MKVVSVNIGTAVPSDFGLSALDKRPVQGRHPVTEFGIEGDEQADNDHGGVYYPVYAYAREDLDRWGRELDRRYENGSFGENVTLSGVDIALNMLLGQFWRLGEVRFEVMGPRIPSPAFLTTVGVGLEAFLDAARPGVYLRPILGHPADVAHGGVEAGDDVEILWTPQEHITIGESWTACLGDAETLRRILELPGHSPAWDALAEHTIGAATPQP
ncbi:MOSC domain-containing protein [Rhizohabitans arisaemae]|uniref:MOSC domain-containing protein n=1 Tax=Rhizohabitans arisaemae TaxID=2720610 RepID=UPI0024B1EEA0|nr:MOSC domain-containing protein [Rhizohabitans arisaemae]